MGSELACGSRDVSIVVRRSASWYLHFGLLGTTALSRPSVPVRIWGLEDHLQLRATGRSACCARVSRPRTLEIVRSYLSFGRGFTLCGQETMTGPAVTNRAGSGDRAQRRRPAH